MEVALFITCLTDTFEPRVGVAVVRLLRHFGCTVHFPAGQTCCGQPAYNNGFHDEAAAMGRRLIDVFDGFEHVVTPSGSCATMVIRHLPELLASDPRYADRAARLAQRTWEFGQFLKEILKVDLSAITTRDARPMTYHYSCHHRSIQAPPEAARMLRDLQGLDYRPLEPLDQCCGFGGAFHVLYPAISNAMVRDKLDGIEHTGAQVVVCSEAGCAMTVGGAARRRGMTVEFKHLAEILAEALDLLDEQG
jgi:L-lactate dehydrogenase complex protein LldE